VSGGARGKKEGKGRKEKKFISVYLRTAISATTYNPHILHTFDPQTLHLFMTQYHG